MNDFDGQWIERHFNGALKPEETAELGRRLAENPAAADRFARALRLEAMLGAAFKEQEREVLFTRMLENLQRNLPPPRRSERIKAAAKKRAAAVLVTWRPLTAAAAGVALLGGGGWLAFRANRVTDDAAEPGFLARWRPKVDEGRTGFSRVEAVAVKPDAASVRRRLRGFFVPSVGVRNVPVNQALAALEEQWKSLPHRRGPESAAEVAFVIADGVRKLWTDVAEEPRVTLEMPGVSFLTNLELLAAQAGLKAEVFADGVRLAADERLSAPDAAEVKTWTLPVAKRTVEALARSHQKRALVKVRLLQTPTPEELPVSWLYQTKEGGAGRFDASGVFNMISGKEPSEGNPITGRAASWTDSGEESGALAGVWLLSEGSGGDVPSGSNSDVANTSPEVSMDSKFVEVAQEPSPTYGIDLKIAPEVAEVEGFINYGKPPVINTEASPATPEDAMRSQIATHKAQAERLRDLSGQQLVDEVIAQEAEDTTIQTFQEHYHTARKEYDQLIGEGYGESHPRVAGLKNALEHNFKIMEAAAEQYRNTLQLNTDNIEAALQQMSRMETDQAPADYDIDIKNVEPGSVMDFEQMRRYGATDAPGLVMENLLNAHSGAGLAYKPETETLVLTGDRRTLQAAQRAAGAAEECATAGAAVEVRFVEWEDAPPDLSVNEPGLSREAPRFLSPAQEIHRLTGTAGPDGESIERNEKGNTAMVRFALNAPPVGLKRFYDRKTGDGKATDALEWKLQCDRGGERMSLKMTTQGVGGGGTVYREENVDLFPDQWTSVNINKGEWQKDFGVTVFLRVKPAALRE